MTAAPWRQSIESQIEHLATGATTAEALARGVRGDIVTAEPELAAWVALNDDFATEALAADIESKGAPLQGISVGVKDLIDVAGLPTRAGSTITDATPAAEDAVCVTRLRECGAVVQGKTVTTEFGYFAPGPTRNPHAHDHSPGGSSSGSAAAVGAGIVPLALGTQTAGSLTRPASFCGAAGMVFAHGTVSLDGVTGLSESLDSLGILTRTIDDLENVFHSFFGIDRTESSDSARLPAVHIWSGSELDSFAPSMSALIGMIPEILGTAEVDHIPLRWDDEVRELTESHVTVMSHEAAITLGDTYDTNGSSLSDPLRALVKFGRSVPDDTRSMVLERRHELREKLFTTLAGSSVVIGPAALGPAPSGLSATGSPVLSRPWQLLGLPVVVVPGVRTDTGLPLGLQLIGEPGHESNLFAVARAFESVLTALPPITTR